MTFDRLIALLWGSGAALITLGMLLSPNALGHLIAPSWKAQQYQQVADQLPPASTMAKRYHAIAQALRQGERNYSYTTDRVPMLTPRGEPIE